MTKRFQGECNSSLSCHHPQPNYRNDRILTGVVRLDETLFTPASYKRVEEKRGLPADTVSLQTQTTFKLKHYTLCAHIFTILIVPFSAGKPRQPLTQAAREYTAKIYCTKQTLFKYPTDRKMHTNYTQKQRIKFQSHCLYIEIKKNTLIKNLSSEWLVFSVPFFATSMQQTRQTQGTTNREIR